MMRRLLLITAFLLVFGCVVASAQVSTQNARRMRSGTATNPNSPALPCIPGPPYTDEYDSTTDHSKWLCTAAPSTWTKVVSGGTPGTVTSIATTTPITGGPITSTGTIACPTCVVGPSSAIDGHLAVFDLTTGKLIKDGGAIPSATPGGLNTQVQFNNSGAFGGSADLTWTDPTLMLAGATTTGPDVEVKITGDTVSRVAMGINTSDTARIGFGPGSGNRDAFIEYGGAAGTIKQGGIDADLSANVVAQITKVQSVLTGGTADQAGKIWTFIDSAGKGNAVSGGFKWQVHPAGSTGSSVNAAADALTLDSTKALTLGGALKNSSGKTLAWGNSLTLNGTDGTTLTFPGTSATIARTDAAQTFTGTQAFGAITASGTIVQTSNSAAAFESGPNGSTNPVLRLVNSTASQADGISITGLAAGSGTTIQALTSGTNAGIALKGAGTGGVTINGGQTTSAATDLLINPTTKTSGNLIAAQVNSANEFLVSFGGNVGAAGTGFIGLGLEGYNTAANALASARFAGGTVNGRVFQLSGNIGSNTVGLLMSSDAQFAFTSVAQSGSADAANSANKDTVISRNAAGVVQFGTTTANALGSWTATNGTLSGTLTYGGVTLTNAVTGTGKMVLDNSPIISGVLNAAAGIIGGTTHGADINFFNTGITLTATDSFGFAASTTNQAAKDTRLFRSSAGVFGIGTTSDTTADGSLKFAAAVMSGKATTYNNIATAGQGVPSIYGAGRTTAQVAANSSIATYTVGAADGSFIVSANVNVTTSTTHTFSIEVAYTDETNTARVVTFNVQQLGGTLVTSITNITGAGPYEGVPLHIRAKASTAITIRTNAGGTYTSVTYNAEGVIQQIQ